MSESTPAPQVLGPRPFVFIVRGWSIGATELPTMTPEGQAGPPMPAVALVLGSDFGDVTALYPLADLPALVKALSAHAPAHLETVAELPASLRQPRRL